jgi:hypothetical protein
MRNIIEIPRSQRNKIRVSPILGYEYDWIDVNEKLPELWKKVFIRINDPNHTFGETTYEVFAAEEMKIGVYEGNKWTISPPYPKYDFSLITNKEYLREGCIVTHWCEADPKSITDYENQFEIKGKYDTLKLVVDKANEEPVYRALVHAMVFIEQYGSPAFYNDTQCVGLKRDWQILSDLISLIEVTKE